MATHSRLVIDATGMSPWRHRVKIKDLFVDDPSHEAIDALCERAVKQIDAVIKSEQERGDQKSEGERDYFIQQLDNLKIDFGVNIGAAEDEMVEERESQFNYMLAELYDIGDVKIELRNGKLQKFLWVG